MYRYIHEHWPQIRSASIIFLLSAVAGYVTVIFSPHLMDEFTTRFSEFAEPILGFANWQLFLFIFLNNSVKIFFAMMLGVLFGIIPVIFVISNGFLLGVIAYVIQDSHGWGVLALGILPHGVIEIPVLIVGTAVGLALGAHAIGLLKNNVKQQTMGQLAKRATSFYFMVLLPLLFIASFIEVYITQFLLETLV